MVCTCWRLNGDGSHRVGCTLYVERPTETGLYRDPKNGDLWELSKRGWRWVNGYGWRFIPVGLERVGDAFGEPVSASPQY